MNNIAVAGSSGHAKVVIDIVEAEGRYTIAGLLDGPEATGVLGYEVIGHEDDLASLVEQYSLGGVIVAIGDNFKRARVAESIAAQCPDLPFVNAVHPGASIGKDVDLGTGTVVMAGARINPSCVIGRHCLVSANAFLDHDSTMHDHSSLGSGVQTGGSCVIGECTAVGIGATLIHGVKVGEHTVVGAGAIALQEQLFVFRRVRNAGPACPITQGGRQVSVNRSRYESVARVRP